MMLGQDVIRGLIPHRGAMCLLDTVEYWDAERVVCRTDQHRSPANPLSASARLSSINGVEFAVQAMAVHGGLLAPAEAPPVVGLLVSLRDCVVHCARLDNLSSSLDIEARRVMGNSDVSMYDFAVRAGDITLIEGRASVLLQRGAGR
jgi:predicted hotdog family 3-hydroxylacyl-ACP dehydratase